MSEPFFLGLAPQGFKEKKRSSAIILGIPTSFGTHSKSTSNAPFFLRRVSQQFVWQAENPVLFDIRDRKSKFENFHDLGDINTINVDGCLLQDEIEKSLRVINENCIPIFIGGDHSISYSTYKVVKKRQEGVVKFVSFDHHLDIQLKSGELEDIYNTNVISHIAKEAGDGNVIHVGVSPYITIDKKEIEYVTSYLKRIGRQLVPLSNEQDLLEEIKKETKGSKVYISIDVDVLNYEAVSATTYETFIGMSMNSILALIESIFSSGEVVGIDIVEFDASKNDRSKKTLADATRIAMLMIEIMNLISRGEKNEDSLLQKFMS